MERRVLCVDPDPEERAATAEALRAMGFAVSAAGTVAEANAALGPGTDCVVTEATLPDGDGLELIARARERNDAVAAVLFTGAGYGAVDTARYDEVVEVVPKGVPTARETLASLVDATLANRTQTSYPLPDDEDERLAALATYDLDDEATTRALDRLTTLAVARFGIPKASVNVIAEDEQRLIACDGLDPTTSTREQSVCTFTILGDGVTVVEDMDADPRFDGVDVGGPDLHGVRSYAGARLLTPEGYAIGTFCLYDDQPRSFTEGELADLERFAAEASEQLALRRRGGPAGEINVRPGGMSDE